MRVILHPRAKAFDLFLEVGNLVLIMHPRVAQFTGQAGQLQFQLTQMGHRIEVILAAVLGFTHLRPPNESSGPIERPRVARA